MRAPATAGATRAAYVASRREIVYSVLERSERHSVHAYRSPVDLVRRGGAPEGLGAGPGLAAKRSARRALHARQAQAGSLTPPSEEVLNLLDERAVARQQDAWGEADRLREQIESLGWQVRDTAAGPQLVPRQEGLEESPP